MKVKCVSCLSAPGKRLCKEKNETLVCPRCCAEMRGPGCSGCSYYKAAEKHGMEKMKNRQFRDFMARIDPAIDSAVNEALEIAGKGKIDKGEKLLRDLIREHPDLYMVHYGMGTILSLKDDYAGSIAYYDTCLDIFPYFPEAWFNRGVSYKNLSDVANTIKSMQKVIEFGDSDEAYFRSAQDLVRNMAESIRRDSGLSLDEYLRDAERFDEAFLNMQNGKYEEALSGFQKVSEANNKHAQSYGNIGLCHAFLGNKQEALSAFDKALTIDPEYEPAINNKAVVLGLKDGEKMPNSSMTVEYYREKHEGFSLFDKIQKLTGSK